MDEELLMEQHRELQNQLKMAQTQLVASKLSEDAVELEMQARPVMDELRQLMQNAGLQSQSYAIKLRVKKKADLLEKVERKRTKDKKTEYGLSSITDVIGLRLVSLFREDMIELFRGLVELISHSNETKPNPLKTNSFEEVIIYSPYEHDPLAVSIKLIASTILPASVDVKAEVSTEGYSSIHLVARTSTATKLNDKESFIPVEIQIRTVFEDAWGEIDHKFRYSDAEGKSKVEMNNPMRISENLKILKKFSDSCSLYADEIKRDAIAKNNSKFPVFEIYPVDTSDKVLNFLSERTASEEDIDRFLKFREVLKESCNDKTQTSRTLALVRAADGFLDLCTSISKKLSLSTDDHEFLKFHFSMNAALCLLATYEDKHLRVALDIYQSLESIDSENPMLELRIAQTYSGLGHIDEALRVFERLHEGIDVDKHKYAHAAEVEHIKKLQPYMYGYVLWVKFHTEDALERKLELINKAIDVTKNYDYESDEELKNKYRNNILYYHCELALVSSNEDEAKDTSIKSLVTLIETETEDLNTNIDFLDSLARAYFVLKDYEKSTAFCDAILDLVFGTSEHKTERDYSNEWELVQDIHGLKKQIERLS